MDARFSAGKFKGRWYSDVACQEASFCAWAKKQKTPPGYLRSFIAFLKAHPHPLRRGQSSIDTFVQRTPQADSRPLPQPPTTPGEATREATDEGDAQEGGGRSSGLKRMDFTLSMEIFSASLFDVTAANPDEEVPHSVREALARHPDRRPAETSTRWRFAAGTYPQVLRWLQFNPFFRCRVEEIPQWVLHRVPSFAAGISSVQAAASLKLSAATKRILAELGPLKQSPSQAQAAESRDATATSSRDEHPKSIELGRLAGELMPFQVEALRFCIEHGGRTLLGDEMGLGKTVTALAVALHYKEEWPVLIVAPAPLCNVWYSHAVEWLSKELSADQICVVRSSKQQLLPNIKLQIVSYNLISEETFQRGPKGEKFKVVILDECHQLRGATTKRSKATVPLARAARRSLLLSGTPLVSRAEDAFPLLDAILPDGALPAHSVFATRYRDAYQRDKIGVGELVPEAKSCVKKSRERVVASCRLPELHTLLQQVMLRRTKKDVLHELPAKRRQRVVLELPQSSKENWGPKVADNIASSSSSSSQMVELEQAFASVASRKMAAVADYVQYLLQGSVKFLLFAHHLKMLDYLEETLKDTTSYIRIDGGTPMSERAAAVQEFQEDDEIQVALLSITACSQGLTLTAASVVVFAELYWVPGVLLQAEDRAHRIGQVHSVDVHYLIAPGSIDERMYEAACRRASDTAAAIENNDNTGTKRKKELEAPIVTASEAIQEARRFAVKKKAKMAAEGGRDNALPEAGVCGSDDDDLEVVSVQRPPVDDAASEEKEHSAPGGSHKRTASEACEGVSAARKPFAWAKSSKQ